jgi:hypothetical protein
MLGFPKLGYVRESSKHLPESWRDSYQERSLRRIIKLCTDEYVMDWKFICP